MLKKLIKHEFKASARILLPIYLVFIGLTLLCKLIHSIDIFDGLLRLIPAAITAAYIISIIAAIAVTVIYTITRFYKNLITDEGYLMFTLPVRASSLISSKLITSLSWIIIAIAVVSLSVFFIYPYNTHDIINGIFSIIRAEFGSMAWPMFIEFVILMLVAITFYISLIYLSIAIGQLFNKHKIISSAVAYFAIYSALQVISLIILFMIKLFSDGLFYDTTLIPKLIFPVIIIYNIILIAVFYISTNAIFTKSLNLE